MSTKSRGRKNQREELLCAKNQLLFCMYGKGLYESRAVEVLERYHYFRSKEGYGGQPDLLAFIKGITSQAEDTSDRRKKAGFQVLVMADFWKALIDDDAQFFSQLGKAVEQRKRKQKELPQHYRLLNHRMNPNNVKFVYSYKNIEEIAGSNGGEVNVQRLLSDLGLSLWRGQLITKISSKEKRDLEAYLGHK